MNGELTLRFTTQAQMDIRRMTTQLSDLQRQTASGQLSNDLRGYGSNAARLINTQTLRSSADARVGVLSELQARFSVQASALNQVSTSINDLVQQIRDAVSANDGRAIGTELNLAFASVVNAMNETWNGQPLFSGDRLGVQPIKVTTLDELAAAGTPADIFDESDRHQTMDLGVGTPVKLAPKASELATDLFDTMKQLHTLVQGSGGEIGAPIPTTSKDILQGIADWLEGSARDFTNAEGHAGQLENRFEAQATRLSIRSDLLVKEIGDQSEIDLAQVSTQISTLLVQYEASAKTFSELSKLTLLDYL